MTKTCLTRQLHNLVQLIYLDVEILLFRELFVIPFFRWSTYAVIVRVEWSFVCWYLTLSGIRKDAVHSHRVFSQFISVNWLSITFIFLFWWVPGLFVSILIWNFNFVVLILINSSLDFLFNPLELLTICFLFIQKLTIYSLINWLICF